MKEKLKSSEKLKSAQDEKVHSDTEGTVEDKSDFVDDRLLQNRILKKLIDQLQPPPPSKVKNDPHA
jgi:hypothetical protein